MYDWFLIIWVFLSIRQMLYMKLFLSCVRLSPCDVHFEFIRTRRANVRFDYTGMSRCRCELSDFRSLKKHRKLRWAVSWVIIITGGWRRPMEGVGGSACLSLLAETPVCCKVHALDRYIMWTFLVSRSLFLCGPHDRSLSASSMLAVHQCSLQAPTQLCPLPWQTACLH